jgi:hypothetical protein
MGEGQLACCYCLLMLLLLLLLQSPTLQVENSRCLPGQSFDNVDILTAKGRDFPNAYVWSWQATLDNVANRRTKHSGEQDVVCL